MMQALTVSAPDAACMAECAEMERIEAFRSGDLDAFNQIVLAHQDLLFGISSRLLGDDDMAADATQEAFLAAYKNLHRFRGGSLKAWLARVLINKCYDQLRLFKRRPTAPLDDASDDIETDRQPREIADSSLSVEQSVEMTELSSHLQACLARIPFEYRITIILVDVHAIPYLEAAEILGAPIGTIKSRVARARQYMRALLEEDSAIYNAR